MAWVFTEAGFDAVDVHMPDILNGTSVLSISEAWPLLVGSLMVMCWVQAKRWANRERHRSP